MDRPDEKMRVVFLDHLGFEPLPKLRFPAVAIFPAPSPVSLTHFPIGADHRMAVAINVAAPEAVAKIEIALFVFLIGENIRSGWIWALLVCQNEYGRPACLHIASSYELLLVASTFAIVGAVCCIRVFSPPSGCPWTWLGAGALALLVPIGIHLL